MKSIASKPKSKQNAPPPIQTLRSFCRSVGFSDFTGWRFRRRGWLRTINIAGKQYITSEAIEEFKRRAAAGEFAQQPVVPTR